MNVIMATKDASALKHGLLFFNNFICSTENSPNFTETYNETPNYPVCPHHGLIKNDVSESFLSLFGKKDTENEQFSNVPLKSEVLSKYIKYKYNCMNSPKYYHSSTSLLYEPHRLYRIMEQNETEDEQSRKLNEIPKWGGFKIKIPVVQSENNESKSDINKSIEKDESYWNNWKPAPSSPVSKVNKFQFDKEPVIKHMTTSLKNRIKDNNIKKVTSETQTVLDTASTAVDTVDLIRNMTQNNEIKTIQSITNENIYQTALENIAKGESLSEQYPPAHRFPKTTEETQKFVTPFENHQKQDEKSPPEIKIETELFADESLQDNNQNEQLPQINMENKPWEDELPEDTNYVNNMTNRKTIEKVQPIHNISSKLPMPKNFDDNRNMHEMFNMAERKISSDSYNNTNFHTQKNNSITLPGRTVFKGGTYPLKTVVKSVPRKKSSFQFPMPGISAIKKYNNIPISSKLA